jgi:hypothetical protein
MWNIKNKTNKSKIKNRKWFRDNGQISSRYGK